MSEESASGHRLSVLLVEGDPSVARLVMAALRQEGYLVTGCVASICDAKEAVDVQRPDLVMLNGKAIPFEEFHLVPVTR